MREIIRRRYAAAAVEIASGSGTSGRVPAGVAEVGGRDPHLDHALADRVEPVAARRRPRGDDPAQLGADEVQRGAVLGGVARSASRRGGSRGRRGGGSEPGS